MGKNYVVLLGTKGGPAIRSGSTNPTSSLLVLGDRKIVVDCGLGVTRGLVDQGMALKDLQWVFITHLHSDHYLELGPLIHTAWTAGLSSPLTIFGPLGIERYWQNFLLSMQDDINLRIEDEGRPDLASLVSFKTLDDGEIFEDKEVSVTAMRNEHPPLINTFALRFTSNEQSVVFSGDTAFLPTLGEFAKGADLLIHEAMLESALEALVSRVENGDERLMNHLLRSHTKAADAGKIATMAGVKALALNHLIPSDDPDYGEEQWHEAVTRHWGGTLFIGSDGLRIVL